MRKSTGFQRLYFASKFTAQGLKTCLETEPAFRYELCLAAIMVPAAFWVSSTALDFALLVIPVVLVLIVELLNTAIERIVDHISMENHLLLGQAKDLGSAAVFLSMMLTLMIWVYYGVYYAEDIARKLGLSAF